MYIGHQDPEILREELIAGLGQLFVIYRPRDTGNEIDPSRLYAAIAADAARINEAQGLRVVSMTAMPLRHAGAALGNEGSGYETKAVVVVVYGTP
ncbi:MAG TPA: hypothetical protein VFL03_02580 [Candidatus Limnocylindrales bacterium]|nr:hypothetical protein [Candidatus Limnocylindrales bacterium]